MEFEWDERKRAINLTKHGVDFRDALRIFRDDHRIWGFDEEHSEHEDRWWTLGRAASVLLFVVATERRGVVRLISARKATRDERRTYYESLPD